MTTQLYRPITSNYTCLGCDDVLPAWRGGHCDACIEWDNPGETPGIDDVAPGSPPDPDPAPGRAMFAPDPIENPPDSPDHDTDRDQDRCRNCGGAHHIQRCSELLAALFADPDDQPQPWPDRAVALVNWVE